MPFGAGHDSRHAQMPARLDLAARLARHMAGAAVDGGGRLAVAGLGPLLSWQYTDEALRRLFASPVVETVAREVVRYEVLERAVDGLLEGGALESVLDCVEAAELPRRVTDRLLADGIADQVAARLLDGPELERVVVAALDSPAIERVATRAIESRLLDVVVDRLLASAELWELVDEIARSPSVTEAIGQQSLGFADQVAGQVRLRSEHADARLERTARRVLRPRAMRRATTEKEQN
jgi:hypothetical protein